MQSKDGNFEFLLNLSLNAPLTQATDIHLAIFIIVIYHRIRSKDDAHHQENGVYNKKKRMPEEKKNAGVL